MSKDILEVSPNYTKIYDFTPTSAGSNTYKDVYYTEGKKSVILYDFMDELSQIKGKTYSGDNIPYISGSDIVKADNISELPANLLHLFADYKGSVIYYPLATDLRGYVAPFSGSDVDFSAFNDRTVLKSLRISTTAYNDASNYTLEVPEFYDGIASYYAKNLFNYTLSSNSNITTKSTEFFYCEEVYTSKADTTLELTVSLLDSSVKVDKYNKYCLSFYVRKNSETRASENLTVSYIANEKETAVSTYVDSIGKHTDKATFSNMWERVSCTFITSSLDINKSNIVFKISIPTSTSVGGFLLEENKFGEGSIYFKTILKETPVKYHIPSIWLKTYSAVSNTYDTKDLTNKDWTIIYTKIGGITVSKEVIGDVIISEGIDSSNTRYFSITEGSNTTKRKILDLEVSSIKDYSKRTYYLSYTNSTKTLEVNIYQNGERLKLVDDTDTENNTFEVEPTSFSYKEFSRDNPKSPNSKLYQHILLGGESRDILYPCTRYCDLIYVDNTALSLDTIKTYMKDMMLAKNVPFTASYLNTIKNSDGTTTVKQAKEEFDKAATLISSFFIIKDVEVLSSKS